MSQGGRSGEGAGARAGAGRRLPARLLADSGGLGWRDAWVGRYRDDTIAEPFTTPVSGDLQLVLATRGTNVVESGDGRRWRSALYRPGAIGATAPGNASTLRWRVVGHEPVESLHVLLDAELVREAAAERGRPGGFPDHLRLGNAVVARGLARLGAALEHGAPALEADEMAHALAHDLAATEQSSGPGDRARGLDARALARVIDYLHQHAAERIRLDDLAAVAHVSRYHFLRLFARSAGTTPHRYLARLRLERAARLLDRTSTPVEVVAARCGYGGPSQFGRAFRAEHGCSPSAYRRAVRGR